MSWTSCSPTDDDAGASTTVASVTVASAPRTTGVAVVSSNWKALALGVFVVAGVTGKSSTDYCLV